MLFIGQPPVISVIRPLDSDVLTRLKEPSVLHLYNSPLAQALKRRQDRCRSVVVAAMTQAALLRLADDIADIEIQ